MLFGADSAGADDTAPRSPETAEPAATPVNVGPASVPLFEPPQPMICVGLDVVPRSLAVNSHPDHALTRRPPADHTLTIYCASSSSADASAAAASACAAIATAAGVGTGEAMGADSSSAAAAAAAASASR